MNDHVRRLTLPRDHRGVIAHGHELVLAPDQNHFIAQQKLSDHRRRVPGQSARENLSRFHGVVRAKGRPKLFVSESKQRIVTRTDACNLKVSAIQLKRLAIARGKFTWKKFNGQIGIRHDDTIPAKRPACHLKYAEPRQADLADAFSSASLKP